MNQENEFDKNFQDILQSQKAFDIVSSFWNLFDKNVRSGILFDDLFNLYKVIFKYLKIARHPNTVLNFLYEQLYLFNILQNQKLTNRQNIEKSGISLAQTVSTSSRPKRTVEECEKTEIQNWFREITFEHFFNLQISFFLSVVIKADEQNFVPFWEYIFLHVVSISCQNGEVQQQNSEVTVHLTFQNEKIPINSIFISEDINLEESLIYEQFGRVNMSRKIQKDNKITTIGSTMTNKLEELAKNNFLNLNGSWTKIKESLTQKSPLYVFYVIVHENGLVHLNPAIYDKFLFEEVFLTNKKEKVWRNLLNPQEFIEIDTIERFERLFSESKNPYYLEQLKKFDFECKNNENENFLSDGKQFGLINFPISKNQVDKFLSKNLNSLIFSSETPGLEQIIHHQEGQIECEDDHQIENPLFDNLLKISTKKRLNILLIGKRCSRKSKITNILSKLLNIEKINIDELVDEKFKVMQTEIDEFQEKESRKQEMSTEEKISHESRAFEIEMIKSELEKVKNGEAFSIDFLKMIVKQKLDVFQSIYKGYVFEFSSLMIGKDFLPIIFSQNENKEKSGVNFLINLKLSSDACEKRLLKQIEFNFLKENELKNLHISECELKLLKKCEERGNYIKNAELSETQKEILDVLSPEVRESLEINTICEDIGSSFKYKFGLKDIDNLRRKEEYYFNFDEKWLIDFVMKNHPKYISVDIEGLSIRNIVKSILTELKFEKEEPPSDILEATEISNILDSGRNLENFEGRRNWSFYKTMDCVEFCENDNLKTGSAEFGVNFENFAFVFANEVNKKKFMKEPEKYLTKMPKLNGQFNLVVLTPDNDEIRTISKQIAELYNLKFVDFAEYAQEKLEKFDTLKEEAFKEMKGLFENLNVNFSDVFKGVHLGESIKSIDVLKLFLIENRVLMESRFDQDEELKMLNDKIDPKSKKKPVIKAAKNILVDNLVSNLTNTRLYNEFYDKLRESEQSEEIIKKMPVSSLIPAPISGLRGYLFYNLSFDADMFDLLKSFSIELYKIVSFFNNSDEEIPLLENKKYEMSVSKMLEFFTESQSFLKTSLPEEQVLNIDYKEQQVAISKHTIVDFIDPFKEKIDSEQLKTNYNFEKESFDAELLKYGKSGRVCIISLIDKNWFMFCSPQIQSLQINSELYCFSSEQNKEIFRLNYEQYLKKFSDFNVQNFIKQKSNVFIMGSIGSGLKTISAEIAESKKMSIFDLKKYVLENKAEFIRQRIFEGLLKSGFKSDEQDQQSQIIDDCKTDILKVIDKFEIDPSEEEQLEEKIVKAGLESISGNVVLINLFFSEKERLIFKSDLRELIIKNTLIPDNLIILKTGELIAHQRIFNKEKLTSTFTTNLNLIKTNNEKTVILRKQQLFEEKLKEDNNVQIEDIEVDLNELTLEPEFVIEEEIEKVNSEIIEKRSKQGELIADFIESLKEYEVQMHKVNTELPFSKIIKSILNFIEEHEDRKINHFETVHFSQVKDSPDMEELTVEKKLQNMILSRGYSLSKYGFKDCLNPSKNVTSFDNNVIYKQKIYFFESFQDYKKLLKNPLIIHQNKNIKQSLWSPIIYCLRPILDKQLKNKLKEQLGFKFVNLKKILKFFFEQKQKQDFKEFDFSEFNCKFKKIKEVDLFLPELTFPECITIEDPQIDKISQNLMSGEILTDDQKVFLFVNFYKMLKSEKKGIIFEDFPENISQFEKLQKAKIFPNVAFTFNYDENDYGFAASGKNGVFFKNERPLSNLIKNANAQKLLLEHFISFNYSCLFTINKTKSCESNFEIMRNLIDKHIDSLVKAVNSFNTKDRYCVNLLAISKRFLQFNLTEMGTMLVSKKLKEGLSIIRNFKYEDMFVFKGKVYADERPEITKDLIISSKPAKQNQKKISQYNVKMLIDESEISSSLVNEKFDILCPICHSKNQMVKSKKCLALNSGGFYYFFCSLIHLHKFFESDAIFKAQKINKAFISNALKPPVEIPLEKQLIDELTIAMNYVCKLKLKYPMFSIKETALKLLSIFLKCRNPLKREDYRKKYNAKLNKFISCCQEVERIKEEIDKSKTSFKSVEMNLVSAKIELFLNHLKNIKSDDKQRHLLTYLR